MHKQKFLKEGLKIKKKQLLFWFFILFIFLTLPSLQDLSSLTGYWTCAPAMEAQTTREVLSNSSFKQLANAGGSVLSLAICVKVMQGSLLVIPDVNPWFKRTYWKIWYCFDGHPHWHCFYLMTWMAELFISRTHVTSTVFTFFCQTCNTSIICKS